MIKCLLTETGQAKQEKYLALGHDIWTSHLMTTSHNFSHEAPPDSVNTYKQVNSSRLCLQDRYLHMNLYCVADLICKWDRWSWSRIPIGYLRVKTETARSVPPNLKFTSTPHTHVLW